MTAKDWIEMLVSFFSGAAISALVTIKVVNSRVSRITKTHQTGNTAGGDIVGGDKTGTRK